MEAIHKEELRRNRRFIVDNIGDAEAVCDELVSLRVFDENYVEKVMVKSPAPKEQTKEILRLLTYRGQDAYKNFLTALKSSGNSHISDKLMEPHKPVVWAPITPTIFQPLHEQPKVSEISWPLSTPLASKPELQKTCDREEVKHLLSHSEVYRITDYKDKGFVIRCKTNIPPKDLCINRCFDARNTELSAILKFMDSPISSISASCHLQDAKEMLQKFSKKVCEYKGLEDVGFFMSFFLSFGIGSSEVFDSKNECVAFKEIVRMINDCESLRGKPKIFFVLTIPPGADHTPDSTVTDSCEDRSMVNEDDIFIFHVEHFGHGAWMHICECEDKECENKECQRKDLWFVRAFGDVVYQYSHKLHLLELIEKVNDLLANAVVRKDKLHDKVAEVKVIQKDTRKKLYFFPGITKEHLEVAQASS